MTTNKIPIKPADVTNWLERAVNNGNPASNLTLEETADTLCQLYDIVADLHPGHCTAERLVFITAGKWLFRQGNSLEFEAVKAALEEVLIANEHLGSATSPIPFDEESEEGHWWLFVQTAVYLELLPASRISGDGSKPELNQDEWGRWGNDLDAHIENWIADGGLWNSYDE